MFRFDTRLNCNLCPRNCNVNRLNGSLGYCRCPVQPLVSSIFLHKGEEPAISGKNGICNVFFAHCNLRCSFCQNYQISRNLINDESWLSDYDEIVERISILLDRDTNMLGFVSPTHQVVQMVEIINRLWSKGYKPTIVYNSNGYDNVEVLKALEGIIDVYLPDFKYSDNKIGNRYSDVSNYFDVASKALKEMYRQKGSTVITNDDGTIESGLVVRHLVLPGYSDDSINILDFIAHEISPNLHISLMSQYYPTDNLPDNDELNRTLYPQEYNKVVDRLEELGFKGWIQEVESSSFYRPDFSSQHPFKD